MLAKYRDIIWYTRLQKRLEYHAYDRNDDNNYMFTLFGNSHDQGYVHIVLSTAFIKARILTHRSLAEGITRQL